MCISTHPLIFIIQVLPNVIQTTEGRKDLENIKDVFEILRFALNDK